MVPHIRRARPEESRLLTELAVRSKAYWGYDDSFMESARPELEFQANKFLPDFHVYILEEEGVPLGFCSLIPVNSNTVELHDLFVEPRQIGKGYGTQLWNYTVNVARSLGFDRILFTADPNAEPFYARRGAVRIGERVSAVRPGRGLPMMEYILAEKFPK